jgi:hypothetical protein
VSLVQLARRAVDGVVVERGPAQEPPGSAEAGDPRAFGVALVGDDGDAVGVRERALSLVVVIAGEAAGALATLEHSAAVGADRGVGRDRSGEPTDGFAADVAWCAAASRRMSRSGTPVARSVSAARRAATSVGYVLVSVVMEISSVVSRGAVSGARSLRSGGCGALAER